MAGEFFLVMREFYSAISNPVEEVISELEKKEVQIKDLQDQKLDLEATLS